MKRYLFLILVIIGGVLFSCSKDKDSKSSNGSNDQEVYGEWNLIKFHNGLAGTHEFEEEDIIWVFNPDTTIDVTINVELDQNSPIPFDTSGTYNFALHNDTLVLHRENFDHEFKYYFEQGKLILSDHPELDGPLIIFEK